MKHCFSEPPVAPSFLSFKPPNGPSGPSLGIAVNLFQFQFPQQPASRIGSRRRRESSPGTVFMTRSFIPSTVCLSVCRVVPLDMPMPYRALCKSPFCAPRQMGVVYSWRMSHPRCLRQEREPILSLLSLRTDMVHNASYRQGARRSCQVQDSRSLSAGDPAP